MSAATQDVLVRQGPVRLDHDPLNQLQPLEDGCWLASGNDPHFSVDVPPEYRKAGIVRVTAELDGECLERPCVYFDTGHGWTEAGRVELRPDGPGFWAAVVPVTALAGAARFDPSEHAGRFHFRGLRMERLDPAGLLLDLIAEDSAAFPASAAAVLAHAMKLGQAEGKQAACEWLLSGGAGRLREPPGSYPAWISAHDTLPGGALEALRGKLRAMPARPLLSLLLPLHGASDDQLRDCVGSVQAQCYPDWELLLVGDEAASRSPFVEAALASSSRIRRIPGRADDVAAWNRALEVAAGSFLWLVEGAPLLAPHALLAVAEAAAAHPDASMVYSDCDRIDALGRRHSPSFRPAWNPGLFLSRDYVGGTALLNTRLVRAAGGFRADHAPAVGGDLALRCLDNGGRPRHLPLVLSHWPDAGGPDQAAVAVARRAALAGQLGDRVLAVEAAGDGARLRWPLPEPAPRVSVIIPTRDRVDLLRQCVESILALSTYPDIELLVVDNGSVEPAALDYLAGLESRPRVRVLRYDRPFNYSAINNFAVGEASGEVLALLNNDIEVLTPGWLEEMVANALRPGVGAVGAMLYYPDDTIQHAGVVVGLGGVAGHVYSRQPRGAAGEEGRAKLAQDLSAVTAACLVVPRSAWLEVGGLDEGLAVAFNDIDFCLRLGKAGYRNLWTPHAEFYHHESASRGSEDSEEKQRRFHSEVMFMVERWGDQLDDDPAYNPNLSLQHGAANELASPPRSGLRHWLGHMGVVVESPPEEKGRWILR
ncbi:glycosyltransferase family 2 protein [Luteimonas sp. MJ250]|uniref:glycosyltransferase family 2 protein n=1 Tax=Luteimonas sp. MJ250 TaxID=3129236 RepID=UPI0031BA82BF